MHEVVCRNATDHIRPSQIPEIAYVSDRRSVTVCSTAYQLGSRAQAICCDLRFRQTRLNSKLDFAMAAATQNTQCKSKHKEHTEQNKHTMQKLKHIGK